MFFFYAYPGFSLRSNPGLQLANAFGVLARTNAFGVNWTNAFRRSGWTNAFGVLVGPTPTTSS
ncbi:MAG TPA: hypothetical protein VFT48_17350 [Pyrinomonadaceae bacterium]|nr:hypothetical protein [Pyrinomonadaceae bacterium]